MPLRDTVFDGRFISPFFIEIRNYTVKWIVIRKKETANNVSDIQFGQIYQGGWEICYPSISVAMIGP